MKKQILFQGRERGGERRGLTSKEERAHGLSRVEVFLGSKILWHGSDLGRHISAPHAIDWVRGQLRLRIKTRFESQSIQTDQI